ncbi:MAG: radical SAM protein [Candidatus Thorarchaeota archaeon]
MKSVDAPTDCEGKDTPPESPSHVRTSLAAAMTMGKMQGRFYRGTKLYCINLLLTYDEGCHAKCAYCGLAGSRETETDWTENSFIRVDWPVYPLDDVKQALTDGSCPHVERVCISMITLAKAREDCITVVSELKKVISRISLLITPTIVNKDWLIRAKEAGADKIGVAVDAATPELFKKLRGTGVNGPHKWDKYWQTVEESVEIYGPENVGIHLIVGVGETEQEIIQTIQRAQDMGADTHLFSFYPEEGSDMADIPQPPLGAYRRVQLARYLINYNLGNFENMEFNDIGQVVSFGIDKATYDKVMDEGLAFMTSGCSGETMDNACNRPFGNCTPFQAAIGHWRNYPIVPIADDTELIREQIQDYSLTYDAEEIEREFE